MAPKKSKLDSLCGNQASGLHPAYFETFFEQAEDWDISPANFAIITAYSTTGVSWTARRNEAADMKLEHTLRQREKWMHRLTGYSPRTWHAEPGWAVEMDFDTACDIGRMFLQDAIYYVDSDTLYVSLCGDERQKVEVGKFSNRVHGPDR